jgi:hypothetical protein
VRRKARVTLEGTEALTITEARVLIKAALAGRFTAVMPGDVCNVEIACEKVAEALIAAGQDRELVEKLLKV